MLPNMVLVLVLIGTGDDPPGWRVDEDAVALALQLEARCTFTARPYHGDTTSPPFRHPPLSPEPLLLQPDATMWPPGLSAWRDQRAFVRRHGDLLVEPRPAMSVATGGARRAAPGETHQHQHTRLRTVIDDWHRHQAAARGHSHVVFERAKLADPTGSCEAHAQKPCQAGSGPTSSWLDRGGAAMAADLGWIATFGANARAGASAVAFDSLVLSVAPVGHGLPRHSHGASWFALAVGTKVLPVNIPSAAVSIP